MSIIVKGMEMPKDCPFCPMAHWNIKKEFTGCDAVAGKWYAMNDPEYAKSDCRPEWCPLEKMSCKDCKHFESDSWMKVNGVPLIVAHEICKKWGDGCKTSEEGYCFMYERKEKVSERGGEVIYEENI